MAQGPEVTREEATLREAAALRDYVYAVIPGPPLPSPRLRATVAPTAPFLVLRRRASSATNMRDLTSCFRARVYQGSDKIRAWSKLAALELERAKAESGYRILPADYPIEILILVVAHLPRSAERKTLSKQPGRRWLVSRGGGDADNFIKPILDAATGILWDDDCQIARVTAETVRAAQGEEPRLEMLALPLGDSPNQTAFEHKRIRLRGR
jgi:Holliday junction resolvase RusA-like endonuclease